VGETVERDDSKCTKTKCYRAVFLQLSGTTDRFPVSLILWSPLPFPHLSQLDDPVVTAVYSGGNAENVDPLFTFRAPVRNINCVINRYSLNVFGLGLPW
jgi:hypothetical protein